MLAGALLGATGSLRAQTTFYWDADGDTTEETGGSGIWDSGSSLWRSGSVTGTLAQWPNTDPAVDYAQLEGTPGTVTLNGDSVNIIINRIIFGTSDYEIAGPVSGTATLNLSGSTPTITTGAGITAEISGFLMISVLVPSGTTFAGSPSPATTVQGVEVAIGGSLDLAIFARSVEEAAPNPGHPSAPSGYEWHTFRLVDPISSQSRGFLRASFNIP